MTASPHKRVVFQALVCSAAFLFLYVSAKGAGRPGGPDASLYGLLLLFVVCTVAGQAVLLLPRVPPLAGMIVAGVVLRNVGAINGLPSAWMGVLKGCAEAVIFLRAGMGLDFQILKQSGSMFFGLAIVPGLVEASVAATVAMRVFKSYNLGVGWGFMLGFVLSDVSPAVTVPILLDFILKGYGARNGVPTILLAAGGLNGIISITAFGICESFVFSTGQAVWLTCVLGIVQIIGGLFLGIAAGITVAWVWDWAPSQSQSQSELWRFLLVLLLSGVGIFLGKYLSMGGGGTLAVITMGVVMKIKLQHRMAPLETRFKEAWASVGQTLLFGLLGAQVKKSG